jgi:hypothetical protein
MNDTPDRLRDIEEKLFHARAVITALMGITTALALRLGARPEDVATLAREAGPGGDPLKAGEAAVRITTHLVRMGNPPQGRA